MEITWLGYSCFRLKGKSVTVITDPYPPGLGYNLDKPSARIVTVSHSHSNHSYTQAIGGEPKVIYRPGEYEIGGVLIIGVATFHDAENGSRLGKNNVFVIEMDDINICHLGDLGHPLTTRQVEEIGNIDILLVPVGAGSTINASQAAGIVRNLEPRIVIPMHFKTPELKIEMETAEKFLKEMGVTNLTPQAKLNITKSTLPEGTQVILLNP